MGIEFSLQSLLIIEFFALIFHNQERSGKKKTDFSSRQLIWDRLFFSWVDEKL
jgi:hypothetical protein